MAFLNVLMEKSQFPVERNWLLMFYGINLLA